MSTIELGTPKYLYSPEAWIIPFFKIPNSEEDGGRTILQRSDEHLTVKVLVVNTLYPPHVVGGAEKSVNLLCEAMVRMGINVVVVSLHPEQSATTEIMNGVKVYRLPIDNAYWAFDQSDHPKVLRMQWHLRDVWNERARNRFAQILDIERPTVIHTNNLTGFSVAVWAEARRRSQKVVHTLRDYSLLCRRATLFRNGKNCERRCTDCAIMTLPSKWQSGYVNGVISNSRFLLDIHLAKGYFSHTPVDVIHNIMETVDASSSQRLRKGQPVTFGYIGKVDVDKGIEVLLKAASVVTSRNWELKIAGSGNSQYIARLKREFTDPRIEWLGFVATIDFFNRIDVTIIPSIWFEPLPRVLIESIAYRRPVICSTAGGIPEIANYADLVGMYEPSDVGALAQLMDRAISEARFADTFNNAGNENLSASFGAETVVDRNVAAYQAALSSNSSEKA